MDDNEPATGQGAEDLPSTVGVVRVDRRGDPGQPVPGVLRRAWLSPSRIVAGVVVVAVVLLAGVGLRAVTSGARVGQIGIDTSGSTAGLLTRVSPSAQASSVATPDAGAVPAPASGGAAAGGAAPGGAAPAAQSSGGGSAAGRPAPQQPAPGGGQSSQPASTNPPAPAPATSAPHQPQWVTNSYRVHQTCTQTSTPTVYCRDSWTKAITTYAPQVQVDIVVDNGAGGAPCGAVRFHLYLDNGQPVTDTRYVGYNQGTNDTGWYGAGNATTPPYSHTVWVQAEAYPNNGCVSNTLGAWDGLVTIKTYS